MSRQKTMLSRLRGRWAWQLRALGRDGNCVSTRRTMADDRGTDVLRGSLDASEPQVRLPRVRSHFSD